MLGAQSGEPSAATARTFAVASIKGATCRERGPADARSAHAMLTAGAGTGPGLPCRLCTARPLSACTSQTSCCPSSSHSQLARWPLSRMHSAPWARARVKRGVSHDTSSWSRTLVPASSASAEDGWVLLRLAVQADRGLSMMRHKGVGGGGGGGSHPTAASQRGPSILL